MNPRFDLCRNLFGCHPQLSNVVVFRQSVDTGDTLYSFSRIHQVYICMVPYVQYIPLRQNRYFYRHAVTHRSHKRTYQVIVIEIALQILAYLEPTCPGVGQEIHARGGEISRNH